jgi:DNA-binding LacI/PurR family transcriptional regulator
MVDNNMAGYEVAKTLFEYGHRRIGLITGPHSLNSSQNRYNGFILFLKEHNLTIEPNLIYEGKYDYDSGFIGTKQLIENKATAIFAFNDLEAYGVLSYCSENHIKVPEDLSIIGFDNLETSAMINPKLSTVEQPIASLAVNASEMIISLIEKKPCEKEIKLNTKLILRDSLRRI